MCKMDEYDTNNMNIIIVIWKYYDKQIAMDNG